MSVISQPVISQPLPTVPNVAEVIPMEQFYRLTIDQYHEMIGAGIFDEDDPVELLDGLLVQKMPKNPPHRIGVKRLRSSLELLIPPGWYVDSQEPISISNSEPEPDGTVVRGKTEDYSDRHPGPDDVALLAEVSADSLKRDRGWKLRLYAKARIPVYWIVNLVDHQVEVYTDPTGPSDQPGYRSRQDYALEEAVPLVIEGREVARIPVRDLLP